jgi:hypothetical protein
METKLTLFAPEDIADYVAMLREWRLNRDSSSRSVQKRLVSAQTPIYVRNANAAAIPPYACMQATGTEEDTETGQNYIVVDQPADVTGGAGAYLFNGPEQIEIGGDGIAQNSRVVRAIKDTGTATAGDSWQPIVSSWEIAAGGDTFVMIGADDIATDCVRVFYAGGGGGILVKTPVGGIPAATGTGPYTFGSATCTIVGGDGVVGAGTVTVKNIVNEAVAGNVMGKASKVGTIYVIDVASCS